MGTYEQPRYVVLVPFPELRTRRDAQQWQLGIKRQLQMLEVDYDACRRLLRGQGMWIGSDDARLLQLAGATASKIG